MEQQLENFPEKFLPNIAEELRSISDTCTEIKETQLNCATADDLKNMGTSITSAVNEKFDTMQSLIKTQTTTVKEIEDNLTTSVDNLKTEIAEKIDNFTVNLPVQKIEKTIRIASESWLIFLAMSIMVFTLILFGATFIWQQSRIEQIEDEVKSYEYHTHKSIFGRKAAPAIPVPPDENRLIEEPGKFILFFKELGITHHIQHFAISFSKDKFDHPATVQSADVTCISLY